MYTIGIIEDEIIEQEALSIIIEKHHPEIAISFIAGNSEIALEYMQQHTPDILLLDVSLPGENGLQLGKRLRKNGYAGLIIINTAYAQFNYAQSAVQINAFDYLLKPCNPEQISKTLSACIANVEALRKSRETQSTLYRLSDSYIFEHLLAGDRDFLPKLHRLGWPQDATFQSFVITFEMQQGTSQPANSRFNQFLQEKMLMYSYSASDRQFVLMQPRSPLSEEKLRLFLVIYALKSAWQYKGHSVYSISPLLKSFDDLIIGLSAIVKDVSFKRTEGFLAFSPPAPAHAAYRQLSHVTSKFSRLLRDKKAMRLQSLFEAAMKESRGEPSDVCALLLCGLLQSLYSCEIEIPDPSLEQLLRGIFNSTIMDDAQQLFAYLEQRIQDHSGQSSMTLALSIITKEFMTPLSQGSIADRLGMNQAYFSQQFKKHTGMNFIDYLTKIRMEHAKIRILESSTLSLNTLSKECGYTSKNYFCNVFRKHTGMTVSQFHKKNTYRK